MIAGARCPVEEIILEHRRSEDISLDRIAAHRAKNVGLRDSLHGFSDNLAPNTLDEMDHGLDDHPRLFVAIDVRNQLLVELHSVERHRPKARDVGIAGAEVVDCDAARHRREGR